MTKEEAAAFNCDGKIKESVSEKNDYFICGNCFFLQFSPVIWDYNGSRKNTEEYLVEVCG